MDIILAFHASERGSNPILATIFYFYLFIFFSFCCFYFDLLLFFFFSFFFFFIFNRIDNPPTSAFRYKIPKCSKYFVLFTEIQPFLEFTLTVSVKRRSIFDPTNELFMQQIFYRVYIKFRIFCFLTCPKLLHLSHTKTNC